MIQLPRRSVTRFFIPLIDVLTLLFCIFLLMPMVAPADGTAGTPADLARLRDLEREVERLRRQGSELTAKDREDLERLRQKKIKALQQHLLIRVLEIDPTSGKLYVTDPERIEIRNQDDARDLVERDGRGRLADNRELYYLILYPRDRKSPYPLRAQREEFERWFGDVAHGWDIPGTGPARGGNS
jgi:hypothetical protein